MPTRVVRVQGLKKTNDGEWAYIGLVAQRSPA